MTCGRGYIWEPDMFSVPESATSATVNHEQLDETYALSRSSEQPKQQKGKQTKSQQIKDDREASGKERVN